MSSSRFSAFFFVIVGCCFFSSIAATQYSVDLPYKQISVEKSGSEVIFGACELIGEPGRPNLPGYDISFLIPPEVDFEDVTVSLNNLTYQDLAGAYEISPAAFWDLSRVSSSIIDGKDTTVYRKDKFFPSEFKGKVVFDKLWHYKVVRVEVYPYIYNPVKNKLRKLTGGNIDLSFNAKQANVNSNLRITSAENTLRNIVVNPEVLGSYGAISRNMSYLASPLSVQASAPLNASETNRNYAIITTSAIYNESACKTMLDTYKAHLENDDGYTNVVIATEDMWKDTNTAKQRSINIREWIKTQATNANHDWHILLIGNPDWEYGDVPMYSMHNILPQFGTDYFYGDLDVELTDRENTFQEVAVGRIPVYDESYYPRLNEYLQKVIDYKTSSDVDWRRFTLIPIAPAFPVGFNDFNVGKHIYDYSVATGFEARRLYEPYGWTSSFKGLHPDVVNSEPLPEVPFCNPDLVVSNWNKYTPGFVFWQSHGNPQKVISVLGLDDIPKLNTGNHPAIVFSGSCDVANPNVSGNLATELIYSDAAIAFIGSTEIISLEQVLSVGTNVTGNIISYNKSVGDAIKDLHTITRFLDYNRRMVLFGCPEIKISIPPTALYGGPQNLSLTKVSNNEINLSWSELKGAQEYVIERAMQMPERRRIDGWKEIGSVTGSLEFTDNDVTKDNVYLYRIYATNSTTRSGYSAVDSIATCNQDYLPEPPPKLNVYEDCYSAVLVWDEPTDIENETSYNIKRRHITSKIDTLCEFRVVGNTATGKDIFDCAAEDAELSGGAQVESEHNGFIGTGYVGGFIGSTTAEIGFYPRVLVSGKYTLTLRYSSANGTSTNIGLYVNGEKIKNIVCPQTLDHIGNTTWELWNKQSETVTLRAGVNEIVYKVEEQSSNSIVIDHFYVKSLNSYIDDNLIIGERYGYTVSTVNKYGESEDYYSSIVIMPEQRMPVEVPAFGGFSDVMCNSFKYHWRNSLENARLCNEVEISFDKKLPGGGTEKVRNKTKVSRDWDTDAVGGFDDGQVVELRFRSHGLIERDDYASSWSDIYQVTTNKGTPPNLPEVVVSKPQSDRIRLSFIPSSTGPETSGYQVFQKEGDAYKAVKDVDKSVTYVEFMSKKDTVDYFIVRVYNLSDCGKSYSEYSEPISSDQISVQTKYEAEEALLENGAGVNTDHPDYSGSGFVDGFWRKENAKATFSVSANQSSYYTVKMRYSAGNGTSYCMGLYVNGTKIKNLTCPSTGNWNSWGEITEMIYLESGINTIAYKSEWYSSESINIDYIECIVSSEEELTPNIKVYTLDQTLGNKQQTQPRFYIKNEGNIPLTNYSMRYYFTVEDAQTPVFESYYMPSYCNASIELVSGNIYCVLLRFNHTLEANGRIPQAENDGFNFGLHYQNYPQSWNQSNDFSQPSGYNFTLTNKVAVFNNLNKLIYGTAP